MMKPLLALAALAIMSTAAWAKAPDTDAPAPAPVFKVVEANARLPFSNFRINGFHVARDDSLILDAGPGRWYRATFWRSCARDLRWTFERIALDTRPNGTLDRLSTVIIRGRRCPIQTLDRIERPPPGTSYSRRTAAEPESRDAPP